MKSKAPDRRDFLRRVVVPGLVCGVAGERPGSLAAQQAAAPSYDLLVKGGRVVDPSQALSAVRDVAVAGGKIARIAENIPESSARTVMDARGKFVTPGWIDVHVHVYDGVAPLGIPADANHIAKGATTVVDAGSAGAHTFPGLRRMVMNVVDTHVYALLNISVIGQSSFSDDVPFGELMDIRYANPKLAIRTIEANRDRIVGVKVRLSRSICADHDQEALRLAREAADAVNLPLMIHIGDTRSELRHLLAPLKKGDLVTHSFHGRPNGILDSGGRVLAEVRSAVERGVNLDVGHGAGSFSFAVAERALKQELLPGTISSDLHQFNVNGPVFDLATTLSKYMHLGLSLEQVVERVTVNPARLFRFAHQPGSLRVGSAADIAIFAVVEGDFTFRDAMRAERIGHRKLTPVATVKAGRVFGEASIPVVRP